MKLVPPQHRRAGRTAGFSLAELMLVIVIIGLLAAAVATDAIRNLFVATRTRAKMDVSTISSAVESYMIEHAGKAPDSLEALVTPDESGRTYLKDRTQVPNDPWKSPYGYEPPSGQRGFRVYSYGADGQAGGQGDDADIDNFTIAEGDQKQQ